MVLEEQSEYLTLTKRQREKVKKRSLHRYHDLGERVYNPEEIKELYDGVSVPKEIIIEEIVRVKPKAIIKSSIKVPKEKRQYSGSLETSIIKEDLEKVTDFGKRALRGVVYFTLGTSFTLPTMVRKAIESESIDEVLPFIPFIFGGCAIYGILAQTNPKAILPVALTQLGTNIVSGIYEYIRHVRKKAEEYTPRSGRFN